MRRAGVILAVLAALLAAAPAANAHTWTGKTRAGDPMELRMDPGGHTLIVLRFRRELSCRRDGVRSFRRGTFSQRRAFVRVGGRFFTGATRTFGRRGSLVRRGRLRITGRIVGGPEGPAAGTVRERVRLSDGTRCVGRTRFRIPLSSTNAHG